MSPRCCQSQLIKFHPINVCKLNSRNISFISRIRKSHVESRRFADRPRSNSTRRLVHSATKWRSMFGETKRGTLDVATRKRERGREKCTTEEYRRGQSGTRRQLFLDAASFLAPHTFPSLHLRPLSGVNVFARSNNLMKSVRLPRRPRHPRFPDRSRILNSSDTKVPVVLTNFTRLTRVALQSLSVSIIFPYSIEKTNARDIYCARYEFTC